MFNLFQKHQNIDSNEENVNEALIIRSTFESNDDFGNKEELEALYKLEGELEVVLEDSGFDLDGHDIGEGEFTLYIYGNSADKMLEAITDSLSESPFIWFNITLRYGSVTDKDA